MRSNGSPWFVEFAVQERYFLMLVLGGFLLAALTFQTPSVAMWVGFMFAGYSAVANDSIQTIGTFIASNRHQKWWVLWLYIGGIFLAVVTASFLLFEGDVSWQRLTTKGYDQAPTNFAYLQVVAPIFLLILTRLKMPVSTTILLLTSFATTGSAVSSTLMKSVGGYAVAFIAAIVIWMTLGRWMNDAFRGKAHPAWRVGQWLISGALWAVWIQQDAANIAVYLPRQLSLVEFLAFAGVIFAGLGLLFYSGGEKIQEVVDEKNNVVDVRAATVIDLVYAAILLWKLTVSTVPMSTTWVFLGLLGGRELAMAVVARGKGRTIGHAARLMTKDLVKATIGLLVSLIIAVAVNPVIRYAWLGIGEPPASAETVEAAPAEATEALEAAPAAH